MQVSPRPRPRGREPHAEGGQLSRLDGQTTGSPAGTLRTTARLATLTDPQRTRGSRASGVGVAGAHSPGVKTRPPAAPSGCCGRPRRRPSARRPPAHAASTARRVGRAPPHGSRGAGRTCRSARMRAPAGDTASAFLRKGRPASRPCAAPCPRTPLRTGRSCASTARRPSPSVRRRGPSGGDELTGADPAVGLGPSHMGPRSGDRPHHARTRRRAPRAGREGGQRPDARVGSCPSSETPRPSSS